VGNQRTVAHVGFLNLVTGLNADKLCQLAAKNGIRQLDLMTSEIALYGLKNLQRAFAAEDV
jgi:hypothetical protein